MNKYEQTLNDLNLYKSVVYCCFWCILVHGCLLRNDPKSGSGGKGHRFIISAFIPYIYTLEN